MKAEEFEKAFLSLSEEEQAKVVQRIMPAFCRAMMQDPAKMREIFSLLAGECGGPMANMISVMGAMMGRRGGGCCG